MTTLNILDESSNTICAVATPPGKGGIAVVRVSGPNAIEVVDTIWQGRQLKSVTPRSATYGHIIDGDDVLDEAVATVFRAPASYTGDDVVEISVHGSPYIQRRLISLLTANPDKCRIAAPGEFTRRAFIGGKLDLAQSEAVADVIASTTKGAHKLAIKQLRGSISKRIEELREKLLTLASLLELELDFSEEDVEFASRSTLLEMCADTSKLLGSLVSSFHTGRATVDGLRVAIVGAPNAGKSTMLNRLLDDEKAIVSDIPGTTRDIVEDTIEIDGILFRFIDTAGIRENPADIVEQTGIDRARDQISKAHIILAVTDVTTSLSANLESFSNLYRQAKEAGAIIIPVINKTDASEEEKIEHLAKEIRSHISLVSSTSAMEYSEPLTHSYFNENSISHIKDRLTLIGRDILNDGDSENPILTNARHFEAATQALTELQNTVAAINNSLTADIIAIHLRSAIDNLASITGEITNPEILTTIFSRFCIGK